MQPWLGTFVEVEAEGNSDSIDQSISAAFERIRKAHELMSFHNSSSELSRINRFACLKPVKVHPWTFQVFQTALQLHKITNGVFDIAVGSKLINAGFLPKHSPFKQRRNGTAADIKLLQSRRIRYRKPMQCDLGGIAKGFAVDQAMESLINAGVKSAYVNAGGDLRVFGPKYRTIQLRDPISKQPSHSILLRNQAMATSAGYFNRKRLKSRSLTPIVHPIRNRFYTGIKSVTVMNHSCMNADALTKAVIFGGVEALSALNKLNANAFVVTSKRAYWLRDNHG